MEFVVEEIRAKCVDLLGRPSLFRLGLLPPDVETTRQEAEHVASVWEDAHLLRCKTVDKARALSWLRPESACTMRPARDEEEDRYDTAKIARPMRFTSLTMMMRGKALCPLCKLSRVFNPNFTWFSESALDESEFNQRYGNLVIRDGDYWRPLTNVELVSLREKTVQDRNSERFMFGSQVWMHEKFQNDILRKIAEAEKLRRSQEN
ncbi:MAG: hypothetical protein MHM6MM_007865 [Cercozoa sp. M6MM]